MKTRLSITAALTLSALIGCNQGTPGGEGVATIPPHKAPARGEAENTFNLSLPAMATTVRQGESKEVPITIERGKNFEGDVSLRFAAGPEGVTFESNDAVIKHGDTRTKFMVKARGDASLGDFTVLVTGHPTKGPDATNELKFTFAKK